MDRSFETEDNSMRPLYAHTLTSSECEIPDHESITPSPSSVEPAVSLGPSTPVVKEHSTTHLSQSPVSTLAASITEGTPEWYLKKLQDKTVDAQQLVTLQTILKGKDTSWVNRFVELRGMSILAHRLYQFSQKKSSREDMGTEQEIIKCITYILNQRSATDIALSCNAGIMVTHVTAALNTPHLPTRRSILDILVFLVYWNDGQAYSLVVSALESLSEDNGETGCYVYWFKSLQAALSGRSSTNGAAQPPQHRGSEADAALTEYLMSNILLMNGIMEVIDDLDVRLHHRTLMMSSGLHNIVRLARNLGIVTIDKQLDLFQQTLEDDEESLDERMSQDHDQPCKLTTIDDVYNALRTKVDSSKAKDHLLSILQHLLLIPDDKPDFVKHFQLIDTVVGDLVMDPKLGGAERRLGFSVERMVSQMNQVERTQKLEEDLIKVRSAALDLKLEKEDLEDRLERSEQMIMSLQTVIARLDCQSEDYTPVVASPKAPKVGYDERIAQLAAGAANPDSPRGLFISPTKMEEAKLTSEALTSPQSAAPKISFWGLTSWLAGKRQDNMTDVQSSAADSGSDEKIAQDTGALAVAV